MLVDFSIHLSKFDYPTFLRRLDFLFKKIPEKMFSSILTKTVVKKNKIVTLLKRKVFSFVQP